MTFEEAKDQVAKEYGYSNWDELYNWIARDGELPPVVAQLMEAALKKVCEQLCEKIKEQELIIYGIEEGSGQWQSLCADKESEITDLKSKINSMAAQAWDDAYNLGYSDGASRSKSKPINTYKQ